MFWEAGFMVAGMGGVAPLSETLKPGTLQSSELDGLCWCSDLVKRGGGYFLDCRMVSV